MWIKRKRTDPKGVAILIVSLTLIGWAGTGFGKYDHVRLALGGYEKQQFTVGENNEQIDVQLNIAGRNWGLGFDDEEEIILIRQDDETLLEGWFFPSDEFALWEDDFLSGEEYTVMGHTEAGPEQYFCSSGAGQYVFLTEIEDSEHSAVFFTPDGADISREKFLEAAGRITITRNIS
ncbi:MAG: hypothetical protein K2P37_13750 [Oscillospiraceae bacterium]|nr:hypothetical protein [Oscillospiraceae bacterium]